jgi:hypothetical protein
MAKKGRKASSSEIQNRALLAFRILSKIFNDVGFLLFNNRSICQYIEVKLNCARSRHKLNHAIIRILDPVFIS